MALRDTTHVLKNSDIVNRPLPSSLLGGEPIVNTADGIVFFSGVTTSTNEWTPAGTGTTANFFEVGSNLYDLKLRNRITEYESISGGGLIGKFLSGTTNGFVLADIADIATAVDSHATGATWNPNVLTIGLNNGKPSFNVLIDSFSALTVNGPLTVTGATNLDNGLTVSGTTNIYGPTNYNQTVGGSNPSEVTNVGFVTAYTNTNDAYVTGGTLVGDVLTLNVRNGKPNVTITGFADDFTTGATLVGTTAYFDRTDALSAYTLDLSSLETNDTFVTGGTYSSGNAVFTNNDGGTFTVTGFTTTDTFVTGFTYSNNLLTLKQNQGQSDLTALIDTMTGLTLSNLAANRVVYTTTGGQLTADTAQFDGLDMILPSTGSLEVGTGGMTVGSGGSAGVAGTGDVTIHGNLVIFGDAITASTADLYIEDNTITLNYNPTGSTNVSSLGSGFEIQDGSGAGTDVTFKIEELNTAYSVEYPSTTGAANRAYYTNLNDIVIRQSLDTTSPTSGQIGKRVLAEDDILFGGTY